MLLKILLIATIITIYTVNLVTTLKCYVCLGSLSSQCNASSVSAMAIRTCQDFPVGKAQCIQAILKPNMGIEERYAARDCGNSRDGKNKCELVREAVSVESCQWCDDKDLCNGIEIQSVIN